MIVFVHQVDDLLHAFFYDLFDGFCFVQLGLLLQVADGIAWFQNCLAVKFLVHTRHDFQQGGFSRTIESQDADFSAIEIGERNILDHLFLIVELVYTDH